MFYNRSINKIVLTFKVTFYSTEIFRDAGLGGQWPTFSSIILFSVQAMTTLICGMIIEKIGRRRPIIISCIGMGLCSFCLALTKLRGVMFLPKVF